MSDAVLVEVIDSLQDLPNNVGRVVLREMSLVNDPVEKFSSGDPLHTNTRNR